MEQPYTNRELDHTFTDIRDTLGRIEAQVIKTNGRVSSLEQWKWFMSGGLAILSVLFIPILLIFIKNWL